MIDNDILNNGTPVSVEEALSLSVTVNSSALDAAREYLDFWALRDDGAASEARIASALSNALDFIEAQQQQIDHLTRAVELLAIATAIGQTPYRYEEDGSPMNAGAEALQLLSGRQISATPEWIAEVVRQIGQE